MRCGAMMLLTEVYVEGFAPCKAVTNSGTGGRVVNSDILVLHIARSDIGGFQSNKCSGIGTGSLRVRRLAGKIGVGNEELGIVQGARLRASGTCESGKGDGNGDDDWSSRGEAGKTGHDK